MKRSIDIDLQTDQYPETIPRKKHKRNPEYTETVTVSEPQMNPLQSSQPPPPLQSLYQCKYTSECSYVTDNAKDLKEHHKSHDPERYCFVCSDCNYRSKSKRTLEDHTRALHTLDKPFKCPECDFRAAYHSKLYDHRFKKHRTKEQYPYQCEHPGCHYATHLHSVFVRHKCMHNGEKPFKCPESGCTFSAIQKRLLQEHFHSFHTPEGQQKHKKKESQIQKLLETEGFFFDRECLIDFGCTLGLDRGQKFARLDFVIPTDRAIFILEVDEFEHSEYGYLLSCELRRMTDTQTSILCSGEETYSNKPIVWIRYNPDSFSVDSQKQLVHSSQRQKQLVKILKEYNPTQDMEIVYMYYSCRSVKTRTGEESGVSEETVETVIRPVIFDNADFSEAIKPMVKKVVIT